MSKCHQDMAVSAQWCANKGRVTKDELLEFPARGKRFEELQRIPAVLETPFINAKPEETVMPIRLVFIRIDTLGSVISSIASSPIQPVLSELCLRAFAH